MQCLSASVDVCHTVPSLELMEKDRGVCCSLEKAVHVRRESKTARAGLSNHSLSCSHVRLFPGECV